MISDPFHEFIAEYCRSIMLNSNKSEVIKWNINNTIVQNLNSKTFYYENDQTGKTILFFILKNKNHSKKTFQICWFFS